MPSAPFPPRFRPLLPPAPPGGFFDGKTSAEERQRYLLDTIRTSTQQQLKKGSCSGEDGSDASGGGLTNAQLNRLLARGDPELELFEAEDRRMQVGGR